jgi:hypothetical protein
LKGNIDFEYVIGNALRKMYLPEDPAKNVFSFSLTNHEAKYYICSFSKDIDSISTRQYVKKDKLINLAKDGAVKYSGILTTVNVSGTKQKVSPFNQQLSVLLIN